MRAGTGRCFLEPPPNDARSWYLRAIGSAADGLHIPETGHSSLARPIVQGKPVARRGRKARDLRRETARLPIQECRTFIEKEHIVKANLARFTWALMLLASLALTVGAGMRWY